MDVGIQQSRGEQAGASLLALLSVWTALDAVLVKAPALNCVWLVMSHQRKLRSFSELPHWRGLRPECVVQVCYQLGGQAWQRTHLTGLRGEHSRVLVRSKQFPTVRLLESIPRGEGRRPLLSPTPLGLTRRISFCFTHRILQLRRARI